MRIILVDDHTLCRSALCDLLTNHGNDVRASDGSDDIPALVAEFQPDLVLLDLLMPAPGGLEILRRLRTTHPDTPVVMLTSSDDERDLFECLRAGAQGYLVKDIEPKRLLASLQETLQGKMTIAPSLTDALARTLAPDRKPQDLPPDPFAMLTPRERDILERLAEGESNKDIARRLGISDGTVKLHVKSVLRKLGVHSRVEAAVKAVDLGLTRQRSYH